MHQHCPGGTYSESEENDKVAQSAKCLPPAQHQTDETPLGQVNRKLCIFLGIIYIIYIIEG